MLLAVAAILGLWLSVDTVRAFRQRATVDAIWSLGGYVRREHEGPEGHGVMPRWYRTLLGDDFMDPLVTIRLAGTEARDEHLAVVGKATRLQMLDLRDTRISDAGLDHLRGLADLRLLILTGTAVSDDGLAKLKHLPRLRLLGLEETRITDRGLQNLTGMANLGWLNLAGTQITDAGLGHLKNCPALEVLIIERCDLSEAALSEFRRASPRTRIFDGSRNRPWLKDFDLDHLNGSNPGKRTRSRFRDERGQRVGRTGRTGPAAPASFPSDKTLLISETIAWTEGVLFSKINM